MMLPGQTLTRRNRLVQMLMGQEQSAPPIQSHTQGLASVLRQGLTGYMSGGDQRDQVEAQSAMIRGLTAKPWVNPDTGQVTDSPAGGYAGMQAALSGIPENEYAQLMMPQLAMADFARQQELADAQRGFKQQIQLEQMKRETGLRDKMDLLMAQEQLSRGRLSAQNEAALQRMFAQNDLTRQRETENFQRQRAAEYADYGLTPPAMGATQQPVMPQQQPIPQSGQPSAIPDDFFAPNQPYMQPLPAQGQPQAEIPTLPPLTLADAKRLAAAQEAKDKAMAKVSAARQASATDNAKAYGAFDAAVNDLQTALSNTSTGPVVGRIPAFTAESQIAEGAVSVTAPLLKQIFRTAGEGSFTDKDQEILLKMIPTRADLPEAQAEKIRMIRSVVNAKLNGPQPAAQPANGMPPATLPPAPAQPSGGLTPDEQAELDQLRARFKK